MASNGLYSREDETFVKKLLEHGVLLDEFVNRFGFTQEQITAMFQSFRKDFYRVFIIEKCGDLWLVLKPDYMKFMGYNDKIITKKNVLKICLTADPHFGSVNDNPGIMDKVEEFCTVEGIEHIVYLGDTREGTEYYIKKYAKGKCRCELDEESELEYLNQNIPYNKLTTKHILETNHDVFSDDGISRDFVKQLRDKYGREDLKVTGFDYAELPVNGDTLYLNHGYVRDFSDFDYENESRLYLCGHSHRSLSRNNLERGYFVEYVTTLSNIEHKNRNRPDEENNFYVGFEVLEIEFNDNKSFNNVLITRYKTTNSPYSKPEALPHQDLIEFSRVRK